MAAQPKVMALVLTWNGIRDTLDCLYSLCRSEYPNLDILVVDNGSTDDSIAVIRNTFPRISIIENRENLGYAEGNNVGIRHALKFGAKYTWLLNNDVVVEKDALNTMVRVAENDRSVGILGSKIYYFDQPEMIWFAGASIEWSKARSVHVGFTEIDTGQYEEIRETERVTGCSMLVRSDLWKQVGMFDGSFFLYAEEVDLCVRVRNHGYRILYVPDSKVYHKISSSTGESSASVYAYYNTRNFLYLIKKNFKFPKREYYIICSILRTLFQCKGTIFRMVFPFLFSKDAVTTEDKVPLIGLYHFATGRMGKGYYSDVL